MFSRFAAAYHAMLVRLTSLSPVPTRDHCCRATALHPSFAGP